MRASVDFRQLHLPREPGAPPLHVEVTKLVCAVCASSGVSALDASDVVQTVLLRAYDRQRRGLRSAFNPARASLGTYVTLLTRSVIGHRRAKRETCEEPTEDAALERAAELRVTDPDGVERATVAMIDAIHAEVA